MLRNYAIGVKGLGFCLFVILGLFCSSLVFAADFPTKTIQIINPNAPGGPADIASRMLTPRLSAILGQSVVVVNKTGGGGTVGIQYVAAAPPDGYTILFTGPTVMLAPLISKDIPFQFEDFIPVNLAVDIPNVLVTKKDAPWQTFEDLIAYAKKNPGKLTFSGGGPGNVVHFDLEKIKMTTGTDIIYIPMEGSAQATIAVVGGHADMTMMAYSGCKGYIDAGSLRALMVMSYKHLKELSSVPAAGEKGYPNLASFTALAFYVPAKTPGAIVKRLGEAFNEVLKDKEIIAKMEKAGSSPVVNLGPEEAFKILKERQLGYAEVVKAGRIRISR